jgi:PAS domain S-box-containing protein
MFGNSRMVSTILVVDCNQQIIDEYVRALSPQPFTSTIDQLRRTFLGDSANAPTGERKYDVVSVPDGRSALATLEALIAAGNTPVVAFVEVSAPVATAGFALPEQLWRRAPDLHVVSVLGPAVTMPESVSARYAENDRFLVLKKPFDSCEVRQLVMMLSTKAQLEQLGRRQRKDLLALSEQLRVLVENASDFMYHRDAQNRMAYVSPGFSQLTGLKSEEWGKLYPSIVADSRQLHSESAKPVVQLTDAEGKRRSFELDERTLDGDGAVQVIGVARDVTKQRVLELELRRAQKLEAIGRFSGGLAHDFNNLLTVISGHAELLKHDEPSEDLENILGATRQAADLTRRLLMFSRDAPGTAELVDLNQLITESSKMFGRLIPDSVSLELCLSDVGRVLISPSELARVLMNLVVNATDAMPQGGTLRIETSLVLENEPRSPKGDFVRILVSDTGEGMTTEVTERIFDPFFTTKGVGNGTGLGLSVVMGIVQQAGGSIHVESQPGLGSVFELYLPLSGDDAAMEAAELARAPCGKGERVLVVDDNPAVADLTARMLRRAGYWVHVTASADKALQMLLHAQPGYRLLVTDVIMPIMNGIELHAKAAKARPGLAVLFMSGYSAQALKEVSIEWEQSVFVAKPWSPVELLKSVRIAIERASVREVAAPVFNRARAP